MRYALYCFDLGLLEADGSPYFDSYQLAATYLLNHPALEGCVILSQATTETDRKYLGDDWQCTHCLDIEDCTVCNPKYKDATIETCARCVEQTGAKSVQTWHLDGQCLHCQGRKA